MTHSTAQPIPLLSNRYQLLSLLGRGGMGTVYHALDRLTGDAVAVKRVQLEAPQDPDTGASEEQRFSLALEFQTLASLRHPHVIGVTDYGFDADRQPFFSMELLGNARTLTEAGADLDRAAQVRLLVNMLQALTYVHRRGIIHRDLKPGNVLVDQHGNVKVLDFGLALHASAKPQTGVVVGTLAYLAPEILYEEPPSVASDLYAVGVMAYELFLDRHPFNRRDVSTLMDETLYKVPDTSRLDRALAGVLDRLLGKTPPERYPDAESVIAALCAAVDEPIPGETIAVRESFLRASTFVGREHEMKRLRDALSAALVGTGSAWLVGGESGVGKTRLLDELRTRALVNGALVLRGQAAETGASYSLWRDVVRRLLLSVDVSDAEAAILKAVVPEIAALLGREVPDAPSLEGKAGQERLTFTIVDLFKRHDQPLLLLLEDVHWAADNLAPLTALLLFAADRPWLIVASYRDDEAPTLPDRLAGMQVITLPRLDDAATAELCAGMLGEVGRQPQVVELIRRETEGNAFFMVEVARALAEEAGALSLIGSQMLPGHVLTGGVQAIMQRRLSHVPAWAQPALRFAAIVGRQIDLRLIEQRGVDVDRWLTECANAAVLARVDEAWRFAHDKLRETILRDLAADETKALRRAAATALESVYGRDPARAEALWHHWRAADEPRHALDCLLIGAEHWTHITADYRRAQTLLVQALTLATPELGTVTYRGWLHFWLGEIGRMLSQYDDTLVHLDSALKNATEPILRLRVINSLASTYMRTTRYDEALELAESVISQARALGDQRNLAIAYTTIGRVMMEKSEYDAGRQILNKALELYRGLNYTTGIANTLNLLGLLEYRKGDWAAAKENFAGSLELHRATGDRLGIAIGLNNMGLIAFVQADWDAAHEYYDWGYQLSREVGKRDSMAVALNNMGAVAGMRGESVKSRGYYEQALKLHQALGSDYDTAVTLNNLGIVAWEMADFDAALKYQSESLELRRKIGHRQGIVQSAYDLVPIYISLGQLAPARECILEVLPIAIDLKIELPLAKLIIRAGLLFAHAGQAERAAELAGAAEGCAAPDEMLKTLFLAPLLTELETRLTPDALKAARLRGAGQSLIEIATQLTDEITALKVD